jgi:uncharacterized lipoprotein YehR (DUF1307 family)
MNSDESPPMKWQTMPDNHKQKAKDIIADSNAIPNRMAANEEKITYKNKNNADIDGVFGKNKYFYLLNYLHNLVENKFPE